MSPVCSMNSGAPDRALILSTAAFKVPATSGLAGLLNPMWLSLICTKLNSPLAPAAFRSEKLLRLYDFSTPPFITQKAPVPAQAMHLRNPRRSIPSWLWSYKSSSFFFSYILFICSSFFHQPESFLQSPKGNAAQRSLAWRNSLRRQDLSLCLCRLAPPRFYSRLAFRGRSGKSPRPAF